MSTLNKHITIPKNVASENDLDFQYLKKIGIEYIESFGGNLWTDFNEHDPGITILEMLSYVISDLGNRIELPIEDLLTSEDSASLDTQFFTADKILTSRPVGELDYRKLFIDIDGVRNCWLSPHSKQVFANCRENKLSYNPNQFASLGDAHKTDFFLKGLYDVLVDFDVPEEMDRESAEYLDFVEEVSQKIRDRYHANRNLCEDLIDVNVIPEKPISVCADIELERTADEEKVHAEILFAIESYFAPEVGFYSLKEMLDKDWRTDEIFDGPLLDHGFIDTDELRSAGLREEVRLSDIMNLISSIDGVKVIKDISIGNCDGTESDAWLLCLPENTRPKLCDLSIFSYKKDILPINLDEAKAAGYLAEIREEQRQEKINTSLNNTLSIPKGKYRQADWYTTLQNDFPDTYGIGQNGLPATATEERKARAKQLKGYLLFFDQILASYFSQLGIVRDLLSSNNELKQTYVTQAVDDIKDFDELVNGYDQNDDQELTHKLFGSLDDASTRRNELLDHLIARFAEQFGEYTFIMKSIYGPASDELVVEAKQNFLSDYHLSSPNRGGAFNYYHQPNSNLWNTANVSGAQRRIVRLGGFKKLDFHRRDISNSYVQVYPFVNADGEDVFRWRIRNTENVIVLTSTEDYQTVDDAIEELYRAVYQIIQSNENNFIDRDSFEDEEEIDNIEVQISGLGNHSFNVINRTGSAPDYVIGRHYTTYSTAAEFKEVVLGIIDFFKHHFSEEGAFLVEHILLRPDVTQINVPMEDFVPISTEDCSECECVDPYSYRVSVVLPGFTRRFSDMKFRDFIEKMIREELPSHILPKICWVGYRKGQVPDDENDLIRFEKTYKKFLEERTDLEQAHDPASLNAFNAALKELNTIYPKGTLQDCGTEGMEGKIILGRTNLGTSN